MARVSVLETRRGWLALFCVGLMLAGGGAGGAESAAPVSPDAVAEAAFQAGLPSWCSELGESYARVFVTTRNTGRVVDSVQAVTRDVRKALSSSVADAVAAGKPATSVEVTIARMPGPDETTPSTKPEENVSGLDVLRLRHGTRELWVDPIQIIARNQTLHRTIGRFADAAGVAPDQVEIVSCPGVQVLVSLGPQPRGTRLYRANTLVPAEAVTREAVESATRLMGEWLGNNVREDGRMTYLYWPSMGEESRGNNAIRQIMGTVALNRFARSRDDDGLKERAARNLRYNLAKFYRREGARGVIQYEGEVKLGAVALAGLAALEQPEDPQMAEVAGSLLATVDYLWTPETGAFRTFYRPAQRNDNQNYYPGEALWVWATRYDQNKDPALLERIMKAFRYYRTWHRENKNSAFIPWHTQAYYLVWKTTKDEELRDFVFEMNDWLAGTQQWDDAPFPDMMGRFFSPTFTGYGAPHASSTGVYLEGLADAFSLARDAGDAERAERYRVTVLRGLRDVMQLQFADEADLFYVTDPDRVRGGIRTEVYNNEIRVDNLQHNIMAAMKALDAMKAEDFVLPPSPRLKVEP